MYKRQTENIYMHKHTYMHKQQQHVEKTNVQQSECINKYGKKQQTTTRKTCKK